MLSTQRYRSPGGNGSRPRCGQSASFFGLEQVSQRGIGKQYWHGHAHPRAGVANLLGKGFAACFHGLGQALSSPLAEVNDPTSSIASANGMFYLIRRSTYQAVGGHAAVRGLAVEDIGIGKRVKAQGLGLLFANGREVLRTRITRASWR